jgi:mono/diheme cytochrome c family protein
MRLFIVMVFAFAAVQVLADDIVAGKKLYTGKCARCHKFYDPTAYDATKWNKWMQKMKLKAKLNDVQYQQLTNYVATLRAGNKP